MSTYGLTPDLSLDAKKVELRRKAAKEPTPEPKPFVPSDETEEKAFADARRAANQQVARVAPKSPKEGTMARIAREVSEGQAAQEKGARQAEGIERAGQMDWGATAELPPRLKGVAIQRHSLTETDKSLPWAEFSTPEGLVKVAQGSMFPGTNYTLTYLGSEPDERGISQLQAEFTSGTGENFIVGGGRSGEALFDYDSMPKTLPPLPGGVASFYGILESFDDADIDKGQLALEKKREEEGYASVFGHLLNKYYTHQEQNIYNESPPHEASSRAKKDLAVRRDDPEAHGTIKSSDHPDWRGTGWTMHEVVGEDMTRYFLEDPESSDVINITGHPDAPRE